MRKLATYLLLYVAVYAGWGVLSPFLPAVLALRGVTAEQIGLLLAIGIAVRLVSTPTARIRADRLQVPRQEIAALLAAAAVIGIGRPRGSRPRRSACSGRSPLPPKWWCSSFSVAHCSVASDPLGFAPSLR